MNYLKACFVQTVQLCKKPGIKNYFKATLIVINDSDSSCNHEERSDW